ncbi:MAG: NAD-dependent epimerase/dehydratase family protein, partial [Verrucomicrobiota bacterium]
MRVLIVGCGYVGLPVGAELVRQGHEVFGLRRSTAAQQELKAVGIKPLYADISQPGDLAVLPSQYDWVVNCVASGGGTPEDYRRTYREGTRNLLQWLQRTPPRKFVYTSSTSVYGQNDGSWVVENDPVEPATESGRVLVETENLLLEAAKEIYFPA